MISARIVADSVAPCGKRLTTFVVTFNRWILAELNTHRMLSRNSASSRAIPTWKILTNVLHSPAMPVEWGRNQAGMQSRRLLRPSAVWIASVVWLLACYTSCLLSWVLSKIGVHKQLANRLTEPFQYITTIVSSTEWENFFALRASSEAQPEFRELAKAMLREYLKSTPRQLKVGEWHVPFGDKYVSEGLSEAQLLKIATARCARVSYLNFEGDIDHEKDYKLHDRLVSQGHFSPTEHCARAEGTPIRSGNFIGFTQYRKLLPNESRTLSRSEMEALVE